MPRKTMLRSIDYFLPYNSEKYTITFIGGEPTLRFDQIEETIEYCKDKYPGKKVEYNIVTNGIALNEDRLRIMKDNAFSAVLSLDGCQEAQDSQRIFKNGSGSFTHVEKNIEKIMKYIGNNRVFVRMTVTPQTVKYLKKSLRYFNEMQFLGIGFVPTYELNWSAEDLECFEDAIVWFLDIWEKELKKRDFVVLPLINYLVHNENPEYIFHYFMHPCQLGSENFSVDVNGNIYPCHRFVSFDRVNKKYILGNVLKNKKKVFFNSPDILGTRQELNTFGCMAVNYDVNKNALKPLKSYKTFYYIYQRIIALSNKRHKDLQRLIRKRNYDSLQWRTKFYNC